MNLSEKLNEEPESERDDTPQVESPIALLPDLSDWGIDEVDRGICEDSFENRKLLRENKATWIMVYTPDGRPTNLIQAVTPEMKEARLLANKSVLLTDSRDPDSDYLTGFDLIVEPRVDGLVPAWVIAATRKWEEIVDERERRKREGGKMFRPAVAGPPSRCRARRLDGHRCQNWTGGLVEQDGLCKMHISTKANREDNFGTNMLTKARNRLVSASLGAVDGLEELAQTATSEPVRLGAMKEILDRAGIRGGMEIDQKVEVTVTNADEVIRKRLSEIAARAEERRERELEAARNSQPEPVIIEATVVSDEDEEEARTYDSQ